MIRGGQDECTPIEVEIGEGRLQTEPAPPGAYEAELSGDGHVLIRASQLDLRNLALRLEALADTIPSPDYLTHVRLDRYFSKAPVGLSDLVVVRCDG